MPRILIVDDEPANVRVLERVLARAGYDELRSLTDSRQVLDTFRSFRPDLILLDLMMPHLDGIAVLGQIRPEIGPDEYLPVLILTADVTLEARHRALAAGARDFLTKPFDHFEVILRIKNLLDTRRLHLDTRRLNEALAVQNRSLEITVEERTDELRTLFHDVPVGLFRATPDGRAIDVNPAALAILGYESREAYLGVDTRTLYVDPADHARLHAELEAAGVVRGYECRLSRRAGGVVWVRVSARAVRAPDGATRYVEGALEDVTERRRMDEEMKRQREALHQSEKVATMGSLLAGVAHELNNPLAVMMAQAYLLRESTEDTVLNARADKIHAAAERCSRIVKNFLALARQRPPERSDVLVNAVVREAIELLAYEFRTGGVEVTVDLAPGLPVLWADGHQLQQVAVNLLVNAYHAMRRQTTERRITVRTRMAVGGGVAIEIADTGPGISQELQEKIFQPFFTTKPVGEGTGLGLSLCRNVVDEHHGVLSVESEPGRGATFTVRLPVGEPPAPAPNAGGAGDVALVTGRRSILVVDDEADIASGLAEVFARDGHDVHTVNDGFAALDRLAARAYDLLVTDSKMPGMDGVEFYREVVRRHPRMRERIIFMTGDVLDRDRLAFLESTGAPYLPKPFDLAEMRRVVRGILAGTGAR